MTLKPLICKRTFGYTFCCFKPTSFGRFGCMRIGEKQTLTQKNKQNGIEWSVLI
jgi:hypothetical protein